MSKAKILVVEDEGLTALNIKSLLENWGHKNPSIALSSDEALQNMAKSKPDLVLMDINLNEDVDGVDIANKLKNDFDVPIIYLTAHSDEAMLERVKLTEPYGYIVKPFSDEELKITIDTALYRHEMEKKLKRTNRLLQIELEKRKHAEDELRKSEEKYRAIVETTHEGIVIFNEEKKVDYANKQMAEIVGYKVEEIIGSHVFNFINDEDRLKVQNELKPRSKGVVCNLELPLCKKDGSYIWTLISGNTLFDSKDNFIGILCMVKDISERKKTEEELKEAHDNLELKVQKRTKELRESNEALKKEIRERKQVEEALVESRNYLDKIIGSIADPVFVKDKQHRWVLLNDAFCQLMGYSREELLGKSDYDLLPSHEADIFWEKDEEVFQTGVENVNEEEITDSEGNLHVIFTKKTLYTDISGEKYIVAIIRDITELKKAEEGKKREHQKLMDIIEFLPDATFVIDRDSNVIAWNRAIEKMTGLSKEKILGTGNYDYSIPFYGFRRPILIDLILSQDNEAESLYDHVEREGDILYADIFVPDKFRSGGKFLWGKASPLYDDNGNFVGAIESIRDISKRKKTEKMLKESEEKFRELFNNANDMIMLTELEENRMPSRFIEVNDIASQRLGYTREELLKMTPQDITAPEDLSEMQKTVKTLLRREHITVEKVHVAKDGLKIPAEVSMHIFELKGKKMILSISRDITERKNAENALTEQFRFLQNLIDTIPYPIFYKDIEYVYQGCNNAFEDVTGLQKDEIVGKTVYDVSPGELAAKYHEKDKYLFENPNTQIYEEKVRYADGTIHNVIFNKKTYNDSNGNITGLMGIMVDITERKEAEESIKNSETYYKTIFENTGTATFIVEEDTTISLVNAEFEKLCGYLKEEIEGKKSWKEFVSQEYIEKMEEFHDLRRINPDLAPRNYEFKFIDRYGNIKDIFITIAMIQGTKKSLASLLDITEKKTAEDALRESEAQLKIAMDLAKIVHWEYDVSSDLFTFDDQFYKLYGTTAKEEGGTQMSSEEYAKKFIPPDESSIVAEETVKALETDDPDYSGQLEHTIIRADGEKRFIIVRYGIIKDKEGHTIKTYGSNQDITERKKAEEEMRKLIKELKRSNDELQQFAYITSHDLQEPLRTIASFTQLIERRYRDRLDEDADEFIDYIVEASIRMKQMILDLLEYSQVARKEKKCKSLECENVLLNALYNLNPLIEENKAIITHDPLPNILADENQLTKVFQNLIENAIKFKREHERPEIHISARKDEIKNEHVFSVADNGIGIEPQYFDRIFTIFQRLHTMEEYNGTGIGLSLSKRIIENYGGKIWVESEPNRGSKFYFTIPIANI